MYGNPAYIDSAYVQKYKIQYQEILKDIGEEFYLEKDKELRDNNLYYLKKGLCALCMEGESGKDISVIYFYPDRLLNFLPSMGGFYMLTPKLAQKTISIPDFFVKAISPCHFLRISPQKFIDRFFTSLPLNSLLIQGLIENVYDLFSLIFHALQLPSCQRLARHILFLMEETPPFKLKRRITYGEIATHLSLHPVTVAKIFKALQANGVIQRKANEINVCDPAHLKRIALGKERLHYKSINSSETEV